MDVYLLSCSAELFLRKQNNVLWAQTWVSGRAKSQTKWDLVNIMARGQLEFRYSPKPTAWQARFDTLHHHYARSNCLSTFLAYFTQRYPLNASGLWYKEGNSLFVIQNRYLLAPYVSFLKKWFIWPSAEILVPVTFYFRQMFSCAFQQTNFWVRIVSEDPKFSPSSNL
jgi:hypothetical protein